MGATATCTRCKAVKPLEAFTADPARINGVRTQCKPCRAESERIRLERKRANANVAALPRRKPTDLEKVPELLSPPPSERPGMGPHLASLEATLERLDLTDVDSALVGLTRTLARGMDGAYGDAREIALISPKYLACLKALCVTRDTAPTAAEETPGLRLASY